MRTIMKYDQFNRLYQESAKSVLKFLTNQMQLEIAEHCYGWRPGLFDFENYLFASSKRFYEAYEMFARNDAMRKICDIGGFWGTFPLTLKKIGYEVTMTESLCYYSDTFTDLFKYLVEEGVNVVDLDPFQENAIPPSTTYDFVTVLAVLEHYPHSPKVFMQNISAMIHDEGRLYIEVPNIVFLPKRASFMRGKTPLVPMRDIFRSKIPFVGHSHEFIMQELTDLAELSSLTIEARKYFNYSPHTLASPRNIVRHPLQALAFALVKDTRECLAICCKKGNATNA